MTWQTKKAIAGKLWELHRELTAMGETHRPIAYCQCETAQLYRVLAAEYRYERDRNELYAPSERWRMEELGAY